MLNKNLGKPVVTWRSYVQIQFMNYVNALLVHGWCASIQLGIHAGGC